MEINVEDFKDIKIVEIIGNFNSDFVSDFKEKIYPLLYSNCKIIAINMGKVEHIDSTGIGGLVSAMKTAKGENKEFVLYDFNDKVKNFFDEIGLKNFFKTMTKQEFELKYKI